MTVYCAGLYPMEASGGYEGYGFPMGPWPEDGTDYRSNQVPYIAPLYTPNTPGCSAPLGWPQSPTTPQPVTHPQAPVSHVPPANRMGSPPPRRRSLQPTASDPNRGWGQPAAVCPAAPLGPPQTPHAGPPQPPTLAPHQPPPTHPSRSPPPTTSAPSHAAVLRPVEPALPNSASPPSQEAVGSPSFSDAPSSSSSAGSSTGVPGPWQLDNSSMLTAQQATQLLMYDVSEAAGQSLKDAVALLNKLKTAWPHDFAACYSRSTSCHYLLARAGRAPIAAHAVKQHEDLIPKPNVQPAAKPRDREARVEYPLEQCLADGLVGQRAAIASVAAHVRRKENGWHSARHPLVLLFLGSSGVGKTELAKTLARYVHGDDPDAFVRLDMSEYQHRHEVSKFIGAPPGYAGHDDGGQLTRQLKRRPNAVVLFDEVEKAHADILTCLLQTFDEGRLTDGRGETVACTDAIFVMTSNLGQQEIADEAVRLRGGVAERLTQDPDLDLDEADALGNAFKTETMMPILKSHFKRDEFLGRINEVVYFLPFSEDQLYRLVRTELERWQRTAAERHAVHITWEAEVEQVLVGAYNIRFGVRSIQHEVDRKVVVKLAEAHEQGLFQTGDHVKLRVVPPGTEVQLLKIAKGVWEQVEEGRRQPSDPALVPRAVVAELLQRLQRLQGHYQGLQHQMATEGRQNAEVLQKEKGENMQLQMQYGDLVVQKTALEKQVDAAAEDLQKKEAMLRDTNEAVREKVLEIERQQHELERSVACRDRLQGQIKAQQEQNEQLEAGLRDMTSEYLACQKYYEERRRSRPLGAVRRIFEKERPEDWRPWHKDRYAPSEESVQRHMTSPQRTTSPHQRQRHSPNSRQSLRRSRSGSPPPRPVTIPYY